MKVCHVCMCNCDDDAELCPVCGADLTEKPEEEKTEDTVINDPVLLATIEDVVSGEIFKDILKDNGIPFACDNTNGEGTMQVLFGGSFVSDNIYVDSSDYERADKLYSEFTEYEEQAFDEDTDFETDGE